MKIFSIALIFCLLFGFNLHFHYWRADFYCESILFKSEKSNNSAEKVKIKERVQRIRAANYLKQFEVRLGKAHIENGWHTQQILS